MKITLNNKMINGFLSYSTEVITTREKGPYSWEHAIKADVFYVRYLAKILLWEKIYVARFQFKRKHDRSWSSKAFRQIDSWEPSCLAMDLIKLINSLENKKDKSDLPYNKIKELEDEYISNNDDFSSGVIFACEQIKGTIDGK